MKKCSNCGAVFEGRRCLVCHNARNKKWRSENVEKCRGYAAKWVANHRDKAVASSVKWALAHPEKVKEYAARARANPKNKEKKADADRRWRMNNMEKWRSICRKWKLENKEVSRVHGQNRRAKQRKNGGKLSSGLAEKLIKLQRGKCACCGELLGDDYHLDHIMPLALGGEHEDKNIQLLRAQCNNQKFVKHPVDFMRSRGFLL